MPCRHSWPRRWERQFETHSVVRRLETCRTPVERFRGDLLDWHAAHSRNYPWRDEDVDPWDVLMAEVCLRRTRADQVVGVFNRLREIAPNPAAMVARPEEVMDTMRALGLRWRAENMIAIARALVNRYDGEVPDTEVELRTLPGVGAYVAQAVLTFGFGRRAVLVDTNTTRIVTASPAMATNGSGKYGWTCTSSPAERGLMPCSTTRCSTSALWYVGPESRSVTVARWPGTAPTPLKSPDRSEEILLDGVHRDGRSRRATTDGIPPRARLRHSRRRSPTSSTTASTPEPVASTSRWSSMAPTSWVRIADDGRGMSVSELDEAMRYGAARRYDTDDQGRYGLGLKTASMSQCRTLTVATRAATGAMRTHIRSWSLDHVMSTDSWQVLRLSRNEAPAPVLSPLTHDHGTVVLWEDLDRLLRYNRPDGRTAENGLASLGLEVSQHLGMVFHRFIAGNLRGRRPLEITVNGDPVAPWDPFATNEPETRALPPQHLEVGTAAGRRVVEVRPYVLPREDRFSNRAAHNRAGGPNRWNRQQGLYIYRANRLIQSGGWNRLRAEDEHTKLARIAIEIPPGAEELFQINVSKMRVTLPGALRATIKALVAGVAATAQDAYRGGVGARPHGPRSSRPESNDAEHLGDPTIMAPVVAVPFDRRLGLYWTELESILTSELAEQPQLLSKVLRQLSRVAAYDETGDETSGQARQPEIVRVDPV